MSLDSMGKNTPAVDFLASEEVRRMLYENSPDPILFIDLHDLSEQSPIVQCNEAAWRLYGYKGKDDLLHCSFTTLHPGKEKLKDLLPRIKAQGQFVQEELGHKQDGSIFPAHCTYRIVPIGEVDFLMVVIHEQINPGQSKELQARLLEAEDRFRAIFDTSPDGVVILNPTNHAQGPWLIEYCNRAFCEMNGYARSELIDRDIRVVTGETATEVSLGQQRHEKLEEGSGGRENHRREYYQRLQQGPISVEEVHIRKDGTAFPIQASSCLISLGGQERVLGIDRDITELKHVQQELARQAEELHLRNDELARLYRASGSLFSSTPFDLQNIADTIVEVIKKEFGQANCSVFLVQSGMDNLKLMAIAGTYASQVRDIPMSIHGAGLVPQAIRTGQASNIPDVLKDPIYIPGWDAARSELTLPLKVGSQVIGAIDVQSAVPDAFTKDDERIMLIFAERAALALEHARLFVQTEHRMQNLLSLRTIDATIASSFDIHFTNGIILSQIIKQMGVHAADILVLDPITHAFQYSTGQGFHTRTLKYVSLHFEDGYAGRAARERHTVIIANLDQSPDGLERSVDFAREGFHTYIGVPLIAKGQVQGVLEVFHREALDLEEERIAFLELMAGQAAIAIDNARLFEHLQNSNAELMMAYDETIEGWSRAMDLRDQETEGHSLRVAEFTLRLASLLGVSMNEMVHIRRGALLHDIGKIGVPDQILRKPGKLTPEEWGIMQRHPQYAHDMLAPILYLKNSIEIPYCHHEKWNGTGYPRALKGGQIPLAARIFAVADVWDALTSDRPYRKAWTKKKALGYIRRQSGMHFDPAVVKAFLLEISREGLVPGEKERDRK